MTMSCPTCNATMQNLGSPGRRVYWCARCGTLKEVADDCARVELPGWLRHVVAAAQLRPGALNQTQSTAINGTFEIRQRDLEPPQVELVVVDNLGRRMV